MPFTAAFGTTPDGWHVGEILEARNVYTQGRSLREVRENLADVIGLLLVDSSPDELFRHRKRRKVTSTRDPVERFFLVL